MKNKISKKLKYLFLFILIMLMIIISILVNKEKNHIEYYLGMLTGIVFGLTVTIAIKKYLKYRNKKKGEDIFDERMELIFSKSGNASYAILNILCTFSAWICLLAGNYNSSFYYAAIALYIIFALNVLVKTILIIYYKKKY